MANYRFEKRYSDGGDLIENGSVIGDIAFGNKFRKDGRVLTEACNNQIWEDGRIVAKIDGDEILDQYSALIGRISDIRREIDGVENLDPILIAGLWITFIKR